MRFSLDGSMICNFSAFTRNSNSKEHGAKTRASSQRKARREGRCQSNGRSQKRTYFKPLFWTAFPSIHVLPTCILLCFSLPYVMELFSICCQINGKSNESGVQTRTSSQRKCRKEGWCQAKGRPQKRTCFKSLLWTIFPSTHLPVFWCISLCSMTCNSTAFTRKRQEDGEKREDAGKRPRRTPEGRPKPRDGRRRDVSSNSDEGISRRTALGSLPRKWGAKSNEKLNARRIRCDALERNARRSCKRCARDYNTWSISEGGRKGFEKWCWTLRYADMFVLLMFIIVFCGVRFTMVEKKINIHFQKKRRLQSQSCKWSKNIFDLRGKKSKWKHRQASSNWNERVVSMLFFCVLKEDGYIFAFNC